MGRKWVGTWLTAIFLAAGLIGGCKSSSQSFADDPLVLSKKAVATKPEAATPVLLAEAEPKVPPFSSDALASVPQGHPGVSNIVALSSPDLSRPAGAPRPVLVVTPAVLQKTPGPIQATPAVRRQVTGVYGHAPDYSWLQGVVDKHYRGHIDLRYCDPTVDDHHGGKVCLQPDARLDQFADGDVIQVVGEIAIDVNASPGDWRSYPHYRIREVWLVEKRKP